MKKFRQLVYPYIAWSIMMLVIPMLLIFMYSMMKAGNQITTFRFTFQHYVRFFTDPDFFFFFWRSLAIALKTTIICLLLGYPIAYAISKTQ